MIDTSHESQIEVDLILSCCTEDKRIPGGMQENATHSIPPENRQTLITSSLLSVVKMHEKTERKKKK